MKQILPEKILTESSFKKSGPQKFSTSENFISHEENILKYYPHYYRRVLSRDLQKFYRENSLLRMVKQLQIEVVSDIENCRVLWDEFSPYETLFDTWDFRHVFWQGYNYKPHFIILKTATENMALLPLWYEDDTQKYRWFGSEWHEDNYFWVKDTLLIPLLLSVSPQPISLTAITSQAVEQSSKMMTFMPDGMKYFLDLSKIHSTDDYLMFLSKKRRYNLKRDFRIIDKKNPQITINNFPDFSALVELSRKRFADKKENCDWNDKRMVTIFTKLLEKEHAQFSIRTISVRINGQIAGVEIIATHKDCYYPLVCGYDVKRHPGIGCYFTVLEMKDALNLKMNKIDVLAGSYGWKDKYFTEIPLFKYER